VRPVGATAPAGPGAATCADGPDAPDAPWRSATRLSMAALDGLPARVARPSFDPAALRCGILHLGCGAFHRAHQAFLTQKAIEAEHGVSRMLRGACLPAWGIAAVSLRTPDTVRALRRQDGLFSVLERGARTDRATVVGTLRRVVHAPAQPDAPARALADPAIRVVTLTVTLAGYCMAPVTGRLDTDDAAVRQDLAGPHPRSAIGVLVEGLRRRRLAGLSPPVVLSCDNVPANGRMLRGLCIDHAALRDDRLATWIARHVQFPCTMVDRIVPSASPDDRVRARAALGLLDAAPVAAEPFHQWVIERFDGPRPRWDAAGAEYVEDVAPWEASKLRLLNGGHLAIGYLGLLGGCATVAETMELPGLSAFALRFMLDEQKPTLPPSDHDIDAYARQLLARWKNHSIAHRLARVTREGTAKLPARLIASLRENRRAGRPAPCTALAVAAWMCCCADAEAEADAASRAGADGRALALEDPVAARWRQDVREVAHDPQRLVDRLLARVEVFGTDLPRDAALRAALVYAVWLLRRRAVRGAVAACVGGELWDRGSPLAGPAGS
jgi:fructuronate reductase